jgi:hypothetical protein
MKLIRMLFGTIGFLMLLLGAHFHFVDQVVCDKNSVEMSLEFARILKLDQAYENIKERVSPSEDVPELEEGTLESEAEESLSGAADETNSYVNDWNNQFSNDTEEAESSNESDEESVKSDDEVLKPSRWGGLVQKEDAYEWTPPGLLSGFLITFGLVISAMNFVTTSKGSSG